MSVLIAAFELLLLTAIAAAMFVGYLAVAAMPCHGRTSGGGSGPSYSSGRGRIKHRNLLGGEGNLFTSTFAGNRNDHRGRAIVRGNPATPLAPARKARGAPRTAPCIANATARVPRPPATVPSVPRHGHHRPALVRLRPATQHARLHDYTGGGSGQLAANEESCWAAHRDVLHSVQGCSMDNVHHAYPHRAGCPLSPVPPSLVGNEPRSFQSVQKNLNASGRRYCLFTSHTARVGRESEEGRRYRRRHPSILQRLQVVAGLLQLRRGVPFFCVVGGPTPRRGLNSQSAWEQNFA